MGFHKVKISTWANNQDLKQYLENEEFNDVSFEDYSKNTSNPYLCLFVDLSKNLDQITSNLINICLAAKEKKQISEKDQPLTLGLLQGLSNT